MANTSLQSAKRGLLSNLIFVGVVFAIAGSISLLQPSVGSEGGSSALGPLFLMTMVMLACIVVVLKGVILVVRLVWGRNSMTPGQLKLRDAERATVDQWLTSSGVAKSDRAGIDCATRSDSPIAENMRNEAYAEIDKYLRRTRYAVMLSAPLALVATMLIGPYAFRAGMGLGIIQFVAFLLSITIWPILNWIVYRRKLSAVRQNVGA